jgi:uncharacterized damage-inducible protein DinB
VEGVAPLLQPVAHALVQAREDLARAVADMDEAHLWMKPNGAASAGFHVLHLAGALDRLFIYARGETLDEVQQAARVAEGVAHPEMDARALVAHAHAAIDRALAELRTIDPDSVLNERSVGREGLPSTVLGLLFHAAEHTTRHVGQLITTVNFIEGM